MPPLCETEAQYKQLLNLTTTLLRAGGFGGHRLTKCPIRCSNYVYRIATSVDFKQEVTAAEKDILSVNLYIAADSYEVKEEVLRYTRGDLIADIGGYLGLLLGSSVLAMYDSTAVLLQKKMG